MQISSVFREVTPLSTEDCFVIINRLKTEFSYPIHVHPEYELNFIENAKGAQRIVGDSIEEIDNLELCLIGNPSMEHAWMTYHCESKEIHEITIQFHKDLFLVNVLPDSSASIKFTKSFLRSPLLSQFPEIRILSILAPLMLQRIDSG